MTMKSQWSYEGYLGSHYTLSGTNSRKIPPTSPYAYCHTIIIPLFRILTNTQLLGDTCPRNIWF